MVTRLNSGEFSYSANLAPVAEALDFGTMPVSPNRKSFASFSHVCCVS
jgi:hypothetical protein